MALTAACSSDSSDTSGGTGGAAQTSSSSSPTGGPSSGSSSAPSSSSGSGMLTCSEEYTTVPKGDCDLLQQDCPVGQFCGVSSEGGKAQSKCLPSKGGLKDKGADCTTNSECKDGMTCIDKHCSPFCCPGTNEPCGGGKCDVNLSFDGDKAIYAAACSYLPICDLFQGSCKDGAMCHLADAASCLAVCDAPSDGFVEEGGTCKFRNDCGDSQLCNNNAPDKGVCRYFCDTTKTNAAPGAGGCPEGRQCKAAGGTGCNNLGICMPM